MGKLTDEQIKTALTETTTWEEDLPLEDLILFARKIEEITLSSLTSDEVYRIQALS